MSTIGKNLNSAWNTVTNAGENVFNPNKIANRTVEVGYAGLGYAGGLVGAGLGVGASAYATQALWNTDALNPVHTLGMIPANAAAQTNTGFAALSVAADVLKAGVEVMTLGMVMNLGLQSVDAFVKLAQQTKPTYTEIKDS